MFINLSSQVVLPLLHLLCRCLLGFNLAEILLAFVVQLLYETIDVLLDVVVFLERIEEFVQLLLMIVELGVGHGLVDALGDLRLQCLRPLNLGVLHEGVLQTDLTDILGEECIQFLEGLVKHTGDAIVYRLLQVFCLDSLRPDLRQLRIELLVINTTCLKAPELLIEVLLQRIDDLACDDWIDFSLDCRHQVHIGVSLLEIQQLMQLREVVLEVLTLCFDLLELIMEVFVERLCLKDCLQHFNVNHNAFKVQHLPF